LYRMTLFRCARKRANCSSIIAVSLMHLFSGYAVPPVGPFCLALPPARRLSASRQETKKGPGKLPRLKFWGLRAICASTQVNPFRIVPSNSHPSPVRGPCQPPQPTCSSRPSISQIPDSEGSSSWSPRLPAAQAVWSSLLSRLSNGRLSQPFWNCVD
jgi:hypothetical protein